MADTIHARASRAFLSAILALCVVGAEASHAPRAEVSSGAAFSRCCSAGAHGNAPAAAARRAAAAAPAGEEGPQGEKPQRSAQRPKGGKTIAAAGGGAAAAATVAAAPVEKSETARTVLVVGDFMAGSLAKGLEEAVSQNREIRVVAKVDGSSGLVREDHFDWPAEIGKTIAETKPSVVVVMLGANDRQAIRDAGPRSPCARPSGATATPRASKRWPRPCAPRAHRWSGSAPCPSTSIRASEDMVYFNDLYRTAALKAGGEFVDVWGGFTDANGAFVASGPDMAGQTARLRNSDGITLTGAGSDKLAYFVEKPVTRILGLSVDDLVASLGSQQMSAADLPSVNDLASATTTPPVSFSDPSLDGGDNLLGGAVAPGVKAPERRQPARQARGRRHADGPDRRSRRSFQLDGAQRRRVADDARQRDRLPRIDDAGRVAASGPGCRSPETEGAADAAARSLPDPARP